MAIDLSLLTLRRGSVKVPRDLSTLEFKFVTAGAPRVLTRGASRSHLPARDLRMR